MSDQIGKIYFSAPSDPSKWEFPEPAFICKNPKEAKKAEAQFNSLIDQLKSERAKVAKLREALEWYAQDPSPFQVPDYLWDQGLRVQTKAKEVLDETKESV